MDQRFQIADFDLGSWIFSPCGHKRYPPLSTMKLAALLTTIFAVTTSAFSPISTSSTHLQASSRSSSTQLFSMPICIVVEAEIKEDRMDEFLDMIEKNAVGSRAEPGCIRFGTYG